MKGKRYFVGTREKLFKQKQNRELWCTKFVQNSKVSQQIYNTIRKSVQLILQHQNYHNLREFIIKINLKFSHFHIFSVFKVEKILL